MFNIKKEISKLDRKVMKEVRMFKSKNRSDSANVNKFFMSFDDEESQERIADIMADFVRLRIGGNKKSYELPNGELGLLFRKYVKTFI